MIKNNRDGKNGIHSDLIEAVNKKGYTELVLFKDTDLNFGWWESAILYKTKENHYCLIEKERSDEYVIRIFQSDNMDDLEIPFLHYASHYQGTITQLKKHLSRLEKRGIKKQKI